MATKKKKQQVKKNIEMDPLKKSIHNADDKLVRDAINNVLKELGFKDIQIRALKIAHEDDHAHAPCSPPKERFCYWDLFTGKRICKCV